MEQGNLSREKLESAIQAEHELVKKVFNEVGKRLVGQKHVAERLVMALIGEGHVLLEGLPGLAKTTFIKALSEVCTLSFKRIQFTPDLLPADVIGTQIYDPKSGSFNVRKGPVFTNLLLADEINRSPAKVQSALLEAMQERQVTIGDTSFQLEEPFLVMATQNPIEHEGTYPLPEAQIDRFLFKVKIGYCSKDEEVEIVNRMATGQDIKLDKVISKEDILRIRKLSHCIHVADKIRHYIVQIVFATRSPKDFGFKDLASFIEVGASPRASINLEKAARINALLQGRNFVTPQDVKDVGLDILRHRIIPTYEAEAENVTTDDIVKKIFEGVDVP